MKKQKLFAQCVGFATLAVLTACSQLVKPGAADIDAVPVMVMYDKSDGERAACSFPLTVGRHGFKGGGACENDYAEMFYIRYPRDGLQFSIHDGPGCGWDDSWTAYRIIDPDYTGTPSRTESVSVSSADWFKPDKLIVRGLYSRGGNVDRLEGKVSCVQVYSDGRVAK